MAKRIPNSSDNVRDLEQGAFRVDTVTNNKFKAVCDEVAHDLLAAILAALGGSADTISTTFNVNIISAGTEVSQALPANTKNFIIRSRNKGSIRLAYTLGGTNTNYLTIPTGSSFVDEQFRTGATIYFQSTKPGDVIEIVAYS